MIPSLILLTTLLVGAAYGEILKVSDVQICADLCTGCGGTVSFDKKVCDCRIPENDDRSVECLRHVIKHENTSDENTGNRGPRCSLPRSRGRIASGDIERVANYFINGGPLTGSQLLGGSKCDYSLNPGISVDEKSHDPPVAEHRVLGASQDSIIGEPCNSPSNSILSSPLIGTTHHSLPTHPHYHGILGIPQAALVPHMPSSIPLHRILPHYFGGKSRVVPLGSVAAEARGIVQDVSDMVASYFPRRNHENIIGQFNDAFLTRHPNSRLAAQYIPPYHGATNYLPYRRASDGYHDTDYAPYASGIYSADVSGAARSVAQKGDPAKIRDILVHHNTVLESMSEQLSGRSRPQVGDTNYPQIPKSSNPVKIMCPSGASNASEAIVGASGVLAEKVMDEK